MTTNIQHPVTPADVTFTDQETRALEALRTRFQQDHDLLSERERAHLRFLRWLVDSGRVAL
ncbi:MAG TPA: hypothetical protein VF898_07505 [Chloroflexota bacterium]